jgi:murein DD-endopeptidase MepM/ murein hydrolase activator NlpD
MQQGSVAVAEGDVVREGQLLGTVGNSGNTSEPHLHIHAEKDGEGVPIRFGGRFLVRNNLMRK